MNELGFKAILTVIFLPMFWCHATKWASCSLTKHARRQNSSFGSWAAQDCYFGSNDSDYAPRQWLCDTGALKGRWRAPGEASALDVRAELDDDGQPGDRFLLKSGTLSWPFESAYGRFVVYGCDVDGDDVDEVVIEDGQGRGTCVYRRRLSVLKPLNGRWRCVLEEWLSDWLPDDEVTDIMWRRRYAFQSAQPAGFDVVFTLLSPTKMPLRMGASRDYAVLQHPERVLRYMPDVQAFRIWKETFDPNPSKSSARKGPSHGAPQTGDDQARILPQPVDNAVQGRGSPAVRQATRRFEFGGRPIHPKLVQQFEGWLSDTGPPVVVTVDVSAAAKARNAYSVDAVKVDGRGTWYAAGEKEHFGYRYLGHMQEGTCVLLTWEWGGGSASFSDLLLVQFREHAEHHHLLMDVVALHPLGGRNEKHVTISPDQVDVAPAKTRNGSWPAMTIKAHDCIPLAGR
jgi:hypothetical protein